MRGREVERERACGLAKARAAGQALARGREQAADDGSGSKAA